MATKKQPIKDVEEVSLKDADAIEVTESQGGYDPLEEIEVQYFKDNGKYKDDIIAGYNGVFYQIQRGVRVKVPRVVDEIITQSMNQDLHSAQYQEALTNEYLSESKKYN